MISKPSYSITRLHADTIRVDRTAPPPARIVAFLMRFRDRRGQPLGWRLDAREAPQTPRRGLWPTPEDAIAAMGLMSQHAAQAAIVAAGAPPSRQPPHGPFDAAG